MSTTFFSYNSTTENQIGKKYFSKENTFFIRCFHNLQLLLCKQKLGPILSEPYFSTLMLTFTTDLATALTTTAGLAIQVMKIDSESHTFPRFRFYAYEPNSLKYITFLYYVSTYYFPFLFFINPNKCGLGPSSYVLVHFSSLAYTS